jgi:Xaa-Pro aminopeptidase
MDGAVFERRREAARQLMNGGVLVLFAAAEFIRNGDVEHAYRQDSDFYYLTGLDEPGSVLVMTCGSESKTTLFVRPRDKERETWDGPRVGVEGAVERLGATEAFPIAELDAKLPALLSGHDCLYYRFGVHAHADTTLIDALTRARNLGRRGRLWPTRVVDSATIVHRMRWRKDDEEVAAMRKAIEITGLGHQRAMQLAAPGKFEFELEAELRHVFRRAGCERVAYQPIVGSGPNATILHHIKNDRQLRDGDLVLIDAGCEYDYYAADVTRTFPANGRFSDAQRRVYDIVLEAQKAAFDAIAPGVTLDDAHHAALERITEGLIELEFIEGPLGDALEQQRYKPFYMHRTGHTLGMDVHDVVVPGDGEKLAPLEPGVVITVEPGIYVAVDEQSVPEEYRGIGIRIEDDALVTSDGCENLSAAIPTAPAEVERWMQG